MTKYSASALYTWLGMLYTVQCKPQEVLIKIFTTTVLSITATNTFTITNIIMKRIKIPRHKYSAFNTCFNTHPQLPSTPPVVNLHPTYWCSTFTPPSGVQPLPLHLVVNLLPSFWWSTFKTSCGQPPPLMLVVHLHPSFWWSTFTPPPGGQPPPLLLVVNLHLSSWWSTSTPPSGG